MAKKWYCDFCREERRDYIIQCYCGKWQSDSYRKKFANSSSVIKCFEILNKHFGYPAETVNKAELFDFIQSFNNNKNNEVNIKLSVKGYVIWLLERLELKTEQNIINVYYKKDKSKTHGQYSSKGFNGYNTIDIAVTSEDSAESIMYICIHEVMHCFLDNHNIKLASEKANETLTDVSVIYFGFGGTFIEGHKIKSGITYTKDMIIPEYRYYGYLSDEQLNIAIELYNKRRLQLTNNYRIVEYNIETLKKEIETMNSIFEKSLKNDMLDKNAQTIMGKIAQKKKKINDEVDVALFEKELKTIKSKLEFDKINGRVVDLFEKINCINTEQESLLKLRKHKIKKQKKKELYTNATEEKTIYIE